MLETKNSSNEPEIGYVSSNVFLIVVDPFTPRALAEPQYYIHARRVIG